MAIANKDGFDLGVNAAVEAGMSLQSDAKIWPCVYPVDVLAIQLKVTQILLLSKAHVL